MATKRQCKHCHKKFIFRPQNPNQQYCSAPPCQKARKREWQKQKLQSDPAYRDNQRDAQQRWREKHPDYWLEYRRRHPRYCEHNRQQQLHRNKQYRSPDTPIAKMDASNSLKHVNPGRYEIRPLVNGRIAKMDASIVEINVISGSSP